MWKRLVIFLVASLCAHGQEIPVPERPADYLWDQTGKVTDTERKSVTRELYLAAGKSGLGVYLVLLNSAPEEPPQDFARRLAERWRGHADRAVLVSGPGMSPPLVVAVAGKSLSGAPESQLKGMTEAALAAGAKAAPGLPALVEAARSVISHAAVIRGGGVPAPATANSPPAASAKNNYVAAWIAGGALLCCMLALLIMRKGRRSALIFPQGEFRQRFSAPHSGGNDAMVFFGKS